MYYVDPMELTIQTSIPTVYQQGLSYYETLNTILQKVNELIAADNAYFSVDMIENLTTILNAMELDGRLTAVVNGAMETEIDANKAAQDIVNLAVTASIALVNLQLTDNTTKINWNRLQAQYMSAYIRKLSTNEDRAIVCVGDSLTYGYDVVSGDKRSSHSDATTDVNNPDITTQASTTYPEYLKYMCNDIFGIDKVSVINRGVSGDTVTQGLARFTNPNADLAILMFGTNDANFNDGDIDTFISNYMLLIEKYIGYGCAIVLLTLPKDQNLNRPLGSAFKNAVFTLGKIYGMPVYDAGEFLEGYSYSYWSDNFHYNGNGYKQFAARVFSIVSTPKGILEPLKLNNNRLQINDNLHSNYTNYMAFTIQTSTGFAESGGGVADTAGAALCLVPQNKGIICFRVEDDETVLFFSRLLASTADIKIDVNFGLALPKPMAHVVGAIDTNASVAPVSVLSLGNVTFQTTLFNIYKFTTDDIGVHGLFFPKKGFYTLRIYDVNNSTDLSYLETTVGYRYKDLIKPINVYNGPASSMVFDFNTSPFQDTFLVLDVTSLTFITPKQIGLYILSIRSDGTTRAISGWDSRIKWVTPITATVANEAITLILYWDGTNFREVSQNVT